MHRITCALIAIFAFTTVSAQTLSDKADRDELTFMQDEEPAMQLAFAKARSELDQFLAIAKSPAPTLVAFSLKVGIREGGNTEYFWVSNFSEAEGRFVGEINNEPRMVKAVKLGQKYSFSRSQIVDWTYIDRSKRKMMGNYTLCALLTKEPPREAEATRKRFNLDCET
jgi:uncharacterized protein YegJ (DUF2314 family)